MPLEKSVMHDYNKVIVCIGHERGVFDLGKILLVASGKGGTGKSSLCAGIASCLALRDQRVLCIDADIGLRNLDISLGLSDVANVTFADVVAGRYDLSAAATHPDLPGLHLLTAPRTLEGLDEALLKDFFASVRSKYDFCLIDSPAGLGEGFRFAASCADECILVSAADPASLRDGEAAAEAAFALGVQEGYVVVNRVQTKLFGWMHTTIDDVMDRVGLPLLGVVPEDPGVAIAAAEGRPLVKAESRKAAPACHRIARRLLGQRVPLPKRL